VISAVLQAFQMAPLAGVEPICSQFPEVYIGAVVRVWLGPAFRPVQAILSLRHYAALLDDC